MWGAYRVCIDDPTARGAAKFLKTIREAIEGLLAATTVVLAMRCHRYRVCMVSIGRGAYAGAAIAGLLVVPTF